MPLVLEATCSQIRRDLKRHIDAIASGATVAVAGSGVVLGDVSPEACARRREQERLQTLFPSASGVFEFQDGEPLDLDAILAEKGR